MNEREFFRSVAERTGLSREEAADLTRATLQAHISTHSVRRRVAEGGSS